MAIDNKDKKVLNVPHLRFPEFSGEWKKYSFNDIAQYKKGPFGSALKKEIFVPKSADSVKIYEQQNAIKKDWELGRYYISRDYFINHMQQFIVEAGDIIVSCAGTIGEIYELPPNAVSGVFNQALMRVRINATLIDKNIFIKVFSSMIDSFSKIYSNGSAIKNIPPFADLKKTNVFLPTQNEQYKISRLISLLDERIATQNKIIEDLKKLKSAIYQNLFFHLQGDKVPLSELAEIIKGQQINGSELSENGKYYVMNGGITPSGYYDNYNTEADTISISEGGNSCGYVQYNSSDFWSGGHCYTLRIKPTALISTPFLFHFLKWKEPDIMALRSGSGLPNIQKKDLSKVCIIVPTLDEQQQLIALLSTFQMKIENEEIFTSNLNKQKQHLLSQMFI